MSESWPAGPGANGPGRRPKDSRSHNHLTAATPVEAFRLCCQSGERARRVRAREHTHTHPNAGPMCCRMRSVPGGGSCWTRLQLIGSGKRRGASTRVQRRVQLRQTRSILTRRVCCEASVVLVTHTHGLTRLAFSMCVYAHAHRCRHVTCRRRCRPLVAWPVLGAVPGSVPGLSGHIKRRSVPPGRLHRTPATVHPLLHRQPPLFWCFNEEST